MARTCRRVALAGAAAMAAAFATHGIAGDGDGDGGGNGAGGAASPPASDRFVVHEWGTFTSMQGSDGVALEGLTREEESLPHFVYSRAEVRDCPLRAQGWKGLEVPPDHVTRKMETPVIYFRSATPRKVRVRVDFMKGLLTQWYPVSDLLGPPEGARDAAPIDVSKVERSFLQWDVELLPRTKVDAAPPEAPTVAPDDPWHFAREVDANWVRTLPRTAPGREGPVEAERYLFYRGLGAFPLPLDVEEAADGTFVLRNRGDVAIDEAIVLQVAGDRAQIVETNRVTPRAGVQATLRGGEWWGPAGDVSEKLQAWFRERLRKQGLEADEARAMVRTWARSWFTSEGTRVLWLVPRATTDAILPLSIDPQPDELVRVLVGRTELIPRAVERDDFAAILETTARDPAVVADAMRRLERHGRFLEPHLRNLLRAVAARTAEGKATDKDEAVRQRVEAWLAKMRTEVTALHGRETPVGR